MSLSGEFDWGFEVEHREENEGKVACRPLVLKVLLQPSRGIVWRDDASAQLNASRLVDVAELWEKRENGRLRSRHRGRE